jgi:hypothetical protein
MATLNRCKAPTDLVREYLDHVTAAEKAGRR